MVFSLFDHIVKPRLPPLSSHFIFIFKLLLLYCFWFKYEPCVCGWMAEDVMWIFKRSKFESTANSNKHDAWLPELFKFSLEFFLIHVCKHIIMWIQQHLISLVSICLYKKREPTLIHIDFYLFKNKLLIFAHIYMVPYSFTIHIKLFWTHKTLLYLNPNRGI